MDTPIYDFLRRYNDADMARLHMPGHKGKPFLGCEPLDITEVHGADALYEADGIIAQSEANATALFGSRRTLYSTEGSSQCIRAMLYLALTCRHDGAAPVVVATRNVHKAFVYAAALLDFEVVWLWPEESRSLCGCPVSPETLEKTLAALPAPPAAVYLTGPDYLGGMADIAALAEAAHRHGTILAVDNAHGAYLRFLSPSRHPMDLGADLCCDSAHKTLPVVTGGAYLHIAHQAPELLHRQAKASMGLWGSSSPSYLILQSLDAANELLADYPEKLQALLPQLESLRRRLAVRGWELLSGEPLKVTLCPKGYGYTGPEVAAALESGGIYPEFYDPDHVVLMVSPQNDPSDLRRLEEVLAALPRRQAIRQGPPPMPRLEQAVTPHEAMLSPWEEVPLEACCGRISAAGALGCPPAVPVVLCGQRMDAAAVEVLRYYGFHRCAVLTE